METLQQRVIKEVKKKSSLKDLLDTEIEYFVDTAISKLLLLKFPYKLDVDIKDIDYPQYQRWLTLATVAMIENQGIATIKRYSEIGMSITYQDMEDGIPKSLIRRIKPEAGVMRE